MRELCNPGAVYQKLMDFMERLARLGLIHCDFNEFNVMVGAWKGPECPKGWPLHSYCSAAGMSLDITHHTCCVHSMSRCAMQRPECSWAWSHSATRRQWQ